MDTRNVGFCFLTLALGVGLASAANANPTQLEGRVLRVDEEQVTRWNHFVEGLLALHERKLQRHDGVVQSERLGGYSGNKKFYRQVSYFVGDSDRRLSRLQWERQNPDRLHLIEVFDYDEQGRVKVDYLAAFLPEHRNAPIQTLINLHNYQEDLHAFRQFDASGNHIYEQCRGHYQDEPVFISLEEHQLRTPEGLKTPVMDTEVYEACFAGMPTEPDAALARVFKLADAPAVAPADNAARRFDTQAMQRLEQVNERLFQNPDEAGLYVARGDLYRDLRKHDKAIADYSRAIALDDTQDAAYFGRGMVHGRAGNLQQAVADLSVYLERHPDSSLAHTKRGVRYIWMGELDKAQADLKRAIELNYRNAEAHDDLGVIHAQRGELSKALHHFETALRLDPSYQKAYHNKAMVLYSRDAFEKALMSINNGLSLDPDNRNSLMLKSTILEAMGRTEQARTIAEHAEFLPEGNWTERFALD